ncbi:Tn3 family transposase [Streptomyces decoyicus]
MAGAGPAPVVRRSRCPHARAGPAPLGASGSEWRRHHGQRPEKTAKFNALLTNAVNFHNALGIDETVRQLLEEGWEIDPEDLAHISPFLHRAHQPVRRVLDPRARHPALV